MLFLMNDVVLNLDAADLKPALKDRRFKSLSLTYIGKLGQELFSENPLLHKLNVPRAVRLASLIMAKEPTINAALFVAQDFNVPPDEVAVRYAQISFDVMAILYQRQQNAGLSTVEADRQVWKRLAA
jgi:hypothetical protein